MRHGANARRARSHRNHNNNGRRSPSNRVHTYDSNGPDVRIRGNAFQINEKYLALARDAAAAGDRVLAESYLQHAEHYQRLINELTGDDASRADQPEPFYPREGGEAPEGEAGNEQPSEDEARGGQSPQQQGEGGGNPRQGGRHHGRRHGRGQYRGRENNPESRQGGESSGKAGFEAADTPSFLVPKTPANEPDAG